MFSLARYAHFFWANGQSSVRLSPASPAPSATVAALPKIRDAQIPKSANYGASLLNALIISNAGDSPPSPIDDDHLAAAVRYVSLNPVRARLVQRAQDWPWSSVGNYGASLLNALIISNAGDSPPSPIDDDHLAAAVRYVSLNPVRARLVQRAQDWSWSSVAAHLSGEDDALVTVAPVLDRYGRFADFLGDGEQEDPCWRALRMSETSGRPLGDADWLEALEAQTGRSLRPQKRGPKGKMGG